MEAIELAIRLLEKVSVMIATVLVLVLLRPAGVWLGETGSQASVRRRLFLTAVLGGLAIWGSFLGFSIGDLEFNVRMVGIIVAGYLGGVGVGVLVGTVAGVVYAAFAGTIAAWVLAASIFVGAAAGLWSRRFGTRISSVVVGTIVIQAVYHIAFGGFLAVVDFEMAVTLGSNLALHAAKITANVVGVILFMALLNLVAELERARDIAAASHDEARAAKLEALQYQVRPHFLFNLLNTLAYLIRTDPPKARELTVELAEFLRYTLSRQDDETSLLEELEQIARYVELERARFGDGLTFHAEVDETVAAHLVVPPLILQPLVENAIRHGAVDGRVDVRIELSHDDRDATILVLDDGPGLRKDEGKERREGGVGLDNVRERLERFYHGTATLDLTARPSGGACARVRIPRDPERRHDRQQSLARQARRRLRVIL